MEITYDQLCSLPKDTVIKSGVGSYALAKNVAGKWHYSPLKIIKWVAQSRDLNRWSIYYTLDTELPDKFVKQENLILDKDLIGADNELIRRLVKCDDWAFRSYCTS